MAAVILGMKTDNKGIKRDGLKAAPYSQRYHEGRFEMSKHTFMLLLTLLLCLINGCATHKKTIKASQFILVDDNGKKRASLSMTGKGPQLAMFGQEEELLVRLDALDDSSHLVFHSRMDEQTPLAPLFVGVANRGNEETGFIQVLAYDKSKHVNSMQAQDNFYFILDPQESVKGIRFQDKDKNGKITFGVTERGVELQLKNDKDETVWQSESKMITSWSISTPLRSANYHVRYQRHKQMFVGLPKGAYCDEHGIVDYCCYPCPGSTCRSVDLVYDKT